MHKIFISYSRSDYNKVIKLTDDIESVVGKGSCWIDLAGIESDRQFVDVIIEAIDKADIFLFMYSKESDKSEWARKEIEYASSEKKRIVFVKIEDIQLSKYFRFQFGGHDIIDLAESNQKQKLIQNLASWCGIKQEQKAEEVKEKLFRKSKGKPSWFTNLVKWIKGNTVEALLILILAIFPFPIFSFIIFILANCVFQRRFKRKYPRYWMVVKKILAKLPIILYWINVVVATMVLFVQCVNKDKELVLTAGFYIIVSLGLLVCSQIRPKIVGLQRRRSGVLFFCSAILLYIASIVAYRVERTMEMENSPSCIDSNTCLVELDTVQKSDVCENRNKTFVDTVTNEYHNSTNTVDRLSSETKDWLDLEIVSESVTKGNNDEVYFFGKIRKYGSPDMYYKMKLNDYGSGEGVVYDNSNTVIGTMYIYRWDVKKNKLEIRVKIEAEDISFSGEISEDVCYKLWSLFRRL